MYTIFADYETGAYLASCTSLGASYTPFTTWSTTSLLFGLKAALKLAMVSTACSFWASCMQPQRGSWLGWAASNKIAAPICGYCLGSFAIFPGIPLTVPYLVAQFNRAFKRKEDAVLQAISLNNRNKSTCLASSPRYVLTNTTTSKNKSLKSCDEC